MTDVCELVKFAASGKALRLVMDLAAVKDMSAKQILRTGLAVAAFAVQGTAGAVEVGGAGSGQAVSAAIPSAPAAFRRPDGWKPVLWPKDLRTIAREHSDTVMEKAKVQREKVERTNRKGRYHADGRSMDAHVCPDWFADAKLGIFIDWGPWSVPSWAPYMKGGRFYPDGYENHCDFPIGSEPAERDTLFRAYHLKNWGEDFHRDHFLALFRAEAFDAAKLMRLFRRCGAKYVVPFLKHHGGFCLWDCPYTFRDSSDQGPRRDLAKEMANACRAEGMKFGFYFSHGLEWGYPVFRGDGSLGFVNAAGEKPSPYRPEMEWTASGKVAVRDFVRDYIVPQATDFIDRYDPDLLWYDGDWTSPAASNGSYDIAAYFYNRADGRKEVACNDRFGFGTPDEVAHKKTTRGGVYARFLRAVRGDFYTSETADITEDLDPAAWHPWEECHGISHAYGNHWQDDETSVMGERELIAYFTDIVARGGNLLLMVNLDGPGRIPEIQRKRLESLGRWLSRWGGAIYGTRPLRPYATESVHYLRSKDARRQFAVVVRNSPTVELECDVPEGAYVRVFGEDRRLSVCRKDGRAAVAIPDELVNAELPYVLEVVMPEGQARKADAQAPLMCTASERPSQWRPPEIMGRGFWPIMTYIPGNRWLGAASEFPEDVAIFRECGIRVYSNVYRRDVPGIRDYPAAARELLGVNEWMKAPKYFGDWVTAIPETIRRTKPYGVKDFFPSFFAEADRFGKDRPLLLQVKESRPAYFLRDDGYPLADRADFAAFRKEFPNFLGFRAISEFDSDTVYYSYHFGAEKVADESLRQRFLRKFPRREDGGWRMRDWTETCYSNSVDMLFGEPSLWPMPSVWCGSMAMLAAAVADRGGNGFGYEASTQSAGPWQLAGAFVRGASRQNRLPFGWYMANYYEGRLRTNVTAIVCGDNRFNDRYGVGGRNGPHRGASLTMLERQLVYGWLIGASHFTTEAWEWLYVAGTNGNYRLSDVGRAIDGIYRLTKRVDRGTPVTPVAMLVATDEPIRISLWTGECRDRHSQAAFFSTLIPTGCENRWTAPLHRQGDQGCLFNSEFGEFYDVVAPDRGLPTDAMAERLRPYACAFLVGDWFDRAKFDRRALEAYVRAGGTLVISADQLKAGYVTEAMAGLSFGDGTADVGRVVRDGSGETPLEGAYRAHVARPTSAKPLMTDENGLPLVWSNALGRGRVLAVACDKFIPARFTAVAHQTEKEFEPQFNDLISGKGGLGLLKHLFRRVQAETMPIAVEGACQWGVNRTEKGHLVWAFNNAGVIKWADEPESFDGTKTSAVRIRLGRLSSGRVTDARTGEALPVRDGAVEFALAPGRWRLLAVEETASAASFSASFDKDFTAETSSGVASGTYSADILWETLATYLKPGVAGTAALIGTGDAKDEDYHAVWENRGYLTPERGGVAFWVCPEDWDGTSTNFHVFFRADGPDADLLVYCYPDQTLKFLMGGRKERNALSVSVKDWKKGDWHYVVATWGEGRTKLYVDGRLLATGDLVKPGSDFRRFGAGGLRPLDWKTPQNHSLIDELLVEAKTLTDFDALSVYLEQRPAKRRADAAKEEIPAEVVAKMKEPETWRGSSAGKAGDAVPAPWTPIAWDASAAKFSCWNRDYVFGDSVLPAQIVAGGRPLLSRAAGLVLDGRPVAGGRLVAVSNSAERIDFDAAGETEAFKVRTHVFAEFDGLVWFDILLEPKSGTSAFRSLTLEFPFRKEASTLFNAMVKQYGMYAPGHAGTFRDYSLDLFRDTSRTMFVGNDEVGLEWFCEEMRDWYVKDSARSLRLVTGERENRLVLNLGERPSRPGQACRYRFGIQAQPVKPLPRAWRRVRFTQYAGGGRTPRDFRVYFPWEKIHNVPIADYALDDLSERYARLAKDAAHVLWYFAGFSVSPYAPMWYKHGPEWSQTPPAVGTVGAPDSRQWAFARVCPAGDGYVDYYVQKLKDTVERLGMGDLYFDNQDPQFCDNRLHGHGWRGQDGKPYKTFNLLATRELNLRIYRMFKRLHPDGAIVRHMSQKNVSPVNAFADFLYDGECYCSSVGRDESYLGIFSPDMFRAQYRTAPYGLPRYFIPQFQRAIASHGKGKEHYLANWAKPEHLAKHRDVLRHYVGYFLVHDALSSEAFGIHLDDWFAIQDRFGFDGTERFVLYADPASPFGYANERVMVSSYAKGARLLVIAFNDTDKPIESLRFDRTKFGALVPGARLDLVNEETLKPVEVAGEEIRVTVPARDYVILGNFK